MSGGDAGAAYRAAVESVAVHAPRRGLLRVTGRAPVRMLDGILTATLPGPETPVEPGVRAGRASWSTLLTPKGRMVSDLRVLRADPAPEGDAARSPGAPPAASPASGGSPPQGMMRGPALAPGKGAGTEEVLLDLPAGGVAGVLDHFRRFLPPRFATVEDVSEEHGALTVLGPGAAALLSLHVLGLRVEEHVLAGLEEGEYRSLDAGGGARLRVLRAGDASVPAFDVLADRSTVDALLRTLEDAGAAPLADAGRDVLRVEAGRPAWGVDMDEDTIPIEAGLGESTIDHHKGCYTGQEVVVRIRDRGHVNRHLRGIRLPEGLADALPGPGTELFAPDVRGERPAGSLTSVATSPRMGPVALGWVRREVAVPGRVRVGATDGPEAEVVDLAGGRWGPEDG